MAQTPNSQSRVPMAFIPRNLRRSTQVGALLPGPGFHCPGGWNRRQAGGQFCGSSSRLRLTTPNGWTSHRHKSQEPRPPAPTAPAPALWTLSPSGEVWVQPGALQGSFHLRCNQQSLPHFQHPLSAGNLQSRKENHSCQLRKAMEKFPSCKCFLYKSQIPELI